MKKEEKITLRQFLRTKTKAEELCVICDCGWIRATVWIDHEDLFHVPPKYAAKPVLGDWWDMIPTVNAAGEKTDVEAHFIEMGDEDYVKKPEVPLDRNALLDELIDNYCETYSVRECIQYLHKMDVTEYQLLVLGFSNEDIEAVLHPDIELEEATEKIKEALIGKEEIQ